MRHCIEGISEGRRSQFRGKKLQMLKGDVAQVKDNT
jgi:hypothetical protein